MGKVDTYMKERTAPRIEGLILGHKSDGRCIYSKVGKKALVEACMLPGMSVAASALANGVNANLLRKWIRQHEVGMGKAGRRKRSEPLAGALLPIHLNEPPPAATVSKPAIFKSPPRLQSSIEIEYAGARVLLHGDITAQQLEVVLTCLARAA
jgi:transposase-like protein